ncbi:MAG: DUF1611 domain-containing protein [Thermoanaerobaculia bacterium]|nr:DUF1611 domain-containing protein [Thermoanaerobaculia bacterium]
MRADDRPAALLLTAGRFGTADAKTAHGLVRGPSRYRVVGVVDGAATAGDDAGRLLDGAPRGIPVHADLASALAAAGERPLWCVVGVATSGGVLSAALRALLLDAARSGLSIVNGLHDLIGDDAEIRAAAELAGGRLVDLRRPKPFRELAFWSGAIRGVRAPRVAVLGTDCALGKRTTCQLLAAALAERGVRAEVVTTGQTGWLQGSRYGFVLDATPNDFVSGELERAVVACDRDLAPDLILLEGQSALRNPSGPCGAELLLSAEARTVVLQHAPARRFFEDQEALGNAIPPLGSEIDLIGHYGARVVGLALNHEHLEPARRDATRAEIAQATGLPTTYPLLDGVAALLPPLVALAGGRAT